MSYICPRCHYETNVRTNFKFHSTKKNICKNIFSDISNSEILESFNFSNEKKIKNFTCIYCNKNYTRKDNMKAHEKSCPVKSITSDKLKILYDKLDIMKKCEIKTLK